MSCDSLAYDGLCSVQFNHGVIVEHVSDSFWHTFISLLGLIEPLLTGIGSDTTIRWGVLKAKVQPPPDKVRLFPVGPACLHDLYCCQELFGRHLISFTVKPASLPQ